MEIIIHTNLKRLEKNEKLAFEEYQKRLRPFCKLTLQTKKEGLLPSFSNRSFRFFVCAGTNTISSEDLATTIKDLNLSGFSTLEFVIDPFLESAINKHTTNELNIMNLTTFNLSDALNTVVLSEQLYRAYTILNNITYHK